MPETTSRTERCRCRKCGRFTACEAPRCTCGHDTTNDDTGRDPCEPCRDAWLDYRCTLLGTYP